MLTHFETKKIIKDYLGKKPHIEDYCISHVAPCSCYDCKVIYYMEELKGIRFYSEYCLERFLEKHYFKKTTENV